MTEPKIFQKTVQHMGEYLERDVSHVTMETRIDAVMPGLDSLKIFEMMLYLEDCFDVDFDQTKLGDVEIMRDLIEHIETRLAIKTGPDGETKAITT